MKHPDTYTISPPSRLQYFRWLRYFGIILAIVYFWMTIDSYQKEGWGFTTILHGVTGLLWLGISYSYFKTPALGSEITLSSEGITFEENGQQQTIDWDNLQSINLTNNSIFLSLNNSQEEELNISYLEYKQLQDAKKQIRLLSEQHNIKFSSKY